MIARKKASSLPSAPTHGLFAAFATAKALVNISRTTVSSNPLDRKTVRSLKTIKVTSDGTISNVAREWSKLMRLRPAIMNVLLDDTWQCCGPEGGRSVGTYPTNRGSAVS